MQYLGSGWENNPPKYVALALALASEHVPVHFLAGLDDVASLATELAARRLLLPASWCHRVSLDSLLACEGCDECPQTRLGGHNCSKTACKNASIFGAVVSTAVGERVVCACYSASVERDGVWMGNRLAGTTAKCSRSWRGDGTKGAEHREGGVEVVKGVPCCAGWSDCGAPRNRDEGAGSTRVDVCTNVRGSRNDALALACQGVASW